MNYDDFHRTALSSRRTRISLGLAALATALTLTVSGCSKGEAAAAAPPPPQVSVAVVTEAPVTQWDDFNGRVEAVDRVALRPRVSGYIEKVNFREGQEVKRGDVLFVIDARRYQAALAGAQADLARARTTAQLRTTEAARSQKLAAIQAASTEELDQRRAAAAQARADVLAAQAAVDTAELNMSFTQVRAPISGRAGRALITEGNLVNADGDSVLTTLVSLDKVHVHFDADERSYLRYSALAREGGRPSEQQEGVPVRVGLLGEDGYPHNGIADFVDNSVDRATGTIRVRATLDNADRALTPGLYARVRLQGERKERAIVIDDKAVMTDQDRKFVFVVDGKGTAQRKDVQLGRVEDGQRVVRAGLTPGDRVIVNGTQKVMMPGMPVAATEVPARNAEGGRAVAQTAGAVTP
ncbi:efflux RND transporter periplasmic adaptor subunit [Alcaligenaceae bacterium C4P045]|nr:efflux RND transporter periplasmic adaptor subunit [Alcaligenaceae bacterium C4P045]